MGTWRRATEVRWRFPTFQLEQLWLLLFLPGVLHDILRRYADRDPVEEGRGNIWSSDRHPGKSTSGLSLLYYRQTALCYGHYGRRDRIILSNLLLSFLSSNILQPTAGSEQRVQQQHTLLLSPSFAQRVKHTPQIFQQSKISEIEHSDNQTCQESTVWTTKHLKNRTLQRSSISTIQLLKTQSKCFKHLDNYTFQKVNSMDN